MREVTLTITNKDDGTVSFETMPSIDYYSKHSREDLEKLTPAEWMLCRILTFVTQNVDMGTRILQ